MSGDTYKGWEDTKKERRQNTLVSQSIEIEAVLEDTNQIILDQQTYLLG
jgi:hypothetical protein